MKFCFVAFLALIYGVNSFNNFADINCGQRGRIGKVVGGSDADKAEFPWLVSITRRGGHFCGGSLINNQFILTAAHCMCTGTDMVGPKNIKASLAQHDLSEKSKDVFEVGIKAITIHPDYSCGRHGHDIAILEMEEKIKWSNMASPACLSQDSSSKDFVRLKNGLATVAGWGWTSEDNSKGGRAKVLQKAGVNVIEREKCQQWYKSQGKKTQIKDNQICAGHEKGGIDACWADSGGPLMIGTGKSNQLMVVGVVSTGIGCARPFLPGLYTRVSDYIPWIRQVIHQ